MLQNVVWATVTRNVVGPLENTNQASVLAMFGGNVALLIVVVGVVGPVVEEVLIGSSCSARWRS